MMIKAGQTVTWSGDFSDHPFEPMPAVPDDPIMDVTSGTTTSVTFPDAGTFGFDCAMHPSIMHGAIEVVP
jgi:plastocyanin